jgi:hypothetical protein
MCSRVILLTATRLQEASNMTRQEVSGDVRTISAQCFELPLSRAAAEMLANVPEIAGKPAWIFTHDGRAPIGGFSKFKRQFDAKMLAELRKGVASSADRGVGASMVLPVAFVRRCTLALRVSKATGDVGDCIAVYFAGSAPGYSGTASTAGWAVVPLLAATAP